MLAGLYCNSITRSVYEVYNTCICADNRLFYQPIRSSAARAINRHRVYENANPV